MENILGWRSQYDRMERWYDRLLSQLSLPRADEGAQDIEALDLFLSFFLNSYALRDWFVKSGILEASEIDEAISANFPMRLCRDLCNRSKHFAITRASVDDRFSILREYRGADKRNALVIIADDSIRDLVDVAKECMNFWKDLIRTREPQEPENPFYAATKPA